MNGINFENGKKRILEDSGLIYEFDGSNWHSVGSGRFLNGVIYQKVHSNDQLSISSTTSQFGVDLTLAGTKAPFRNPPITKLIEFPSNRQSFNSNVHILEVGGKSIELVIPIGFGVEPILEGLTQALLNLPYNHMEYLKSIRVNPYECQDFRERVFAATTDNRPTIDLFPLSLDKFSNDRPFSVRILRHEFGHLIASKIFGQSTPDQNYISIALKDRVGVSEYGNLNWAEDFAEAVETYLRLNAGTIEPNVRQQLQNRFEFLDKVFAQRSPGSVSFGKISITKSQSEQEIIVVGIDSYNLLVLVPASRTGLVLNLL